MPPTFAAVAPGAIVNLSQAAEAVAAAIEKIVATTPDSAERKLQRLLLSGKVA